MVVVPGGSATLKPNGLRLNAKSLRQMRLHEYLLDTETAPLAGEPAQRLPGATFLQRQGRPQRLQEVQVPSQGQEIFAIPARKNTIRPRLLEGEIADRRASRLIQIAAIGILIEKRDIQLAAVRMGQMREQWKAAEKRKIGVERQGRRSGERLIHVPRQGESRFLQFRNDILAVQDAEERRLHLEPRCAVVETGKRNPAEDRCHRVTKRTTGGINAKKKCKKTESTGFASARKTDSNEPEYSTNLRQ